MQLLEAKNPQHTYFNTDVEELDITDRETVCAFVEHNQIDGIVNCAAYTAVDKAEDNQELCDLLNHVAPGYLAEAIERRGGWLIQISTDESYALHGDRPRLSEQRLWPHEISWRGGSSKSLQPYDDYPHGVALFDVRK